jgi:Bacterial self-protective colicin-like immunity
VDTRIGPYRIAANAFIERRVDGSEFESLFLGLFRAVGDDFSDTISIAIRRLFSAVDAYCADAASRDKYDIDEDQLRAAAVEFVEVIREAESGSHG